MGPTGSAQTASSAARHTDGSSAPWLAGLRYYPISGANRPFASDLAATVGHGWDQVYPSGWRLASEIGFSGCRGYLLFATMAIGMPIRR